MAMFSAVPATDHAPMPSTKEARLVPIQAARSAAGRFQSTATERLTPRRADALRRARAASRTIQAREVRFAHLKTPHD